MCQLFAGGAQPQRQDGAGPGMVVSGWIDKVRGLKAPGLYCVFNVCICVGWAVSAGKMGTRCVMQRAAARLPTSTHPPPIF